MAQCYLHPRSCRREYAENWPRFPFSFSDKVIIESGPRAPGYVARIHRHTYSPQMTRIQPHGSPDITFVIMRIYIPDVRCILRSVHVQHGSCMCPVHGIRVTSSNDVPLEHQSRHAISRFLSVGTVNFYTIRRLKLSPAFSLSFFLLFLSLSLFSMSNLCRILRSTVIYHLCFLSILQSVSKLYRISTAVTFQLQSIFFHENLTEGLF